MINEDEDVYYRNLALCNLLNKIIELEKQKWNLILDMLPNFYNVQEINPILLKHIDTLELTVRTSNCLRAEYFEYIGDIVCHPNLRIDSDKDFAQLLKIPNFGKKSFRELKEVLLKKYNIDAHIPCKGYMQERIKIYGSSFQNKHFRWE